MDLVLQEAKTLISEGYQEIVLTGVNTADYGSRTNSSLLSLLRSLVTLQGLERLRISSVEPNLLSDELLSFWIQEPRSASTAHSVAVWFEFRSGPDASAIPFRVVCRTDPADRRVGTGRGIGADVIVGFPGETDAEFEETERLLKGLPVSYLHVFNYSERPGTAAISMPAMFRRRYERNEARDSGR